MTRISLLVLLLTSPVAAQTEDPRSTPRDCVAGFMEAAADGDFARAATFLEDRVANEASARDLFAALRTALPDVADLAPEKADRREILLGTVELESGTYSVRLRQQPDDTWRFGREAVASAPRVLREYEESWIGRHLPSFLSTRQLFGMALWQLLSLVLMWTAGIALGGFVRRAIIRLDRWYAGRNEAEWVKGPLSILPGPVRVFVALWVVRIFSPYLRLTAIQQDSLNLIVRVLLVATVTWFIWRAIAVAGTYLEIYLTRPVTDPVKRRSIHTQVQVPQSILRVIVVSVGAALVFLQFEQVRNVGLSLLASAGVAGVIIGLAAQRSIGNMLAGLQLAFFQPIKMGDIVEVEGAWGTIEEIGLTTVIVKVWDMRRLILPVSYFVEKPVWNWSKSSTEMIGAVMIVADYDTPVNTARDVLMDALRESPLWDGQTASLQVTGITTEAIELRALMSSADGAHLWNLRCHVRERLLQWLQSNGHIPKRRVQSVPIKE